MSPVPLEPPHNRGSVARGDVPVAEGPLLVRGLGMTRWHRPRSGVIHARHNGVPTWQLWCGQVLTVFGDRFETDDAEPTDGLPVCGPCEGRALGAGHGGTVTRAADGTVVFVPDSQTKYRTPKRCPGTGNPAMVGEVDEPHDWRVIRCLACGTLAVIGNSRHGYDGTRGGPREHAPHTLPEPCPFHAWDRLVIRDSRTVCSCEDKAQTL